MIQGLKEPLASSDTYSVLHGGRMNLIVLTGSQTFSPKSTCPCSPSTGHSGLLSSVLFYLKSFGWLCFLYATALKTWNV